MHAEREAGLRSEMMLLLGQIIDRYRARFYLPIAAESYRERERERKGRRENKIGPQLRGNLEASQLSLVQTNRLPAIPETLEDMIAEYEFEGIGTSVRVWESRDLRGF